jgi:hypothetical protein
MKKNEKRCTLYTSLKIVMIMFTNLNEVYATIHKLVKAQLVEIILKNLKNTFVEPDCHPFALFEKNGHTDPKIEKPDNDLCTHTPTHLLFICTNEILTPCLHMYV